MGTSGAFLFDAVETANLMRSALRPRPCIPPNSTAETELRIPRTRDADGCTEDLRSLGMSR